MNRATWRDVVVDVTLILILFVAVLLHAWSMPTAAPWMVAVAAGRWGASTLSKYAAAQAGIKIKSIPPPPASEAGAEGEALPAPVAAREPKPLPSSAVVLLIFAIGSAILSIWTRGRHGA